MLMFDKKLYGKDSKGNIKEWYIKVVGNEIHVSHGRKDGKMQTKVTVCQGKNIGRANEKSPETQAVLEAISKINKQMDKLYRESELELEDLKPLLPMLAHDYTKVGHRMRYPCHVSPKLDDMREKYAADRKKGELKRLPKNRNRTILLNLQRIERTLFKDQLPSWARFRRCLKFSDNFFDSEFWFNLNSVIPCSLGDKLDVIDGKIQLDLHKVKKIMDAYDKEEPEREVYEKVMQEIYNQIKQKSSEITIWEKR